MVTIKQLLRPRRRRRQFQCLLEAAQPRSPRPRNRSVSHAQSPFRVVEGYGARGRLDQSLPDREYVRRLADNTLRMYAHELPLHPLVGGVHHTAAMAESDLTESTLLDYVRFQSAQQPRPTGSPSTHRVAIADRALRNEFPTLCQVAPGFHRLFAAQADGTRQTTPSMSRLRKTSKRNILPLSVDEVARFWSSFRTSRDLAIVGLMLLQGLRSQEVLALNRDDVLSSEAQIRVHGKGNKIRFLPLAPEAVQLLDHYLRLERPNPCTAALFVSLKGPARGSRMTPARLRSLFLHHRQTIGVTLANPHRSATPSLRICCEPASACSALCS
jgi:site-specific recombinase XerD